jgi:hypothetical protein
MSPWQAGLSRTDADPIVRATEERVRIRATTPGDLQAALDRADTTLRLIELIGECAHRPQLRRPEKT